MAGHGHETPQPAAHDAHARLDSAVVRAHGSGSAHGGGEGRGNAGAHGQVQRGVPPLARRAAAHREPQVRLHHRHDREHGARLLRRARRLRRRELPGRALRVARRLPRAGAPCLRRRRRACRRRLQQEGGAHCGARGGAATACSAARTCPRAGRDGGGGGEQQQRAQLHDGSGDSPEPLSNHGGGKAQKKDICFQFKKNGKCNCGSESG